MSMFTKVGNIMHDSLLSGATKSGMSHISSGAGLGVAYGAGSSVVNGDGDILGGALSGGVQGALLGGASRYASMNYARGVANHILNTTDAAGKPLLGVQQSLVADVGNLKFGHFNRPNNNNVHANFWYPDSQANKGEIIMKDIDMNNYNPRFTKV